MSLKNDAINILGAVPLGKALPSVREHTTRLDNTGTIEPPQRGYSRTKFIRSNNMIEIYEYENPIWFGKKGKRFKIKYPEDEITPKPSRKDEYRKR